MTPHPTRQLTQEDIDELEVLATKAFTQLVEFCDVAEAERWIGSLEYEPKDEGDVTKDNPQTYDIAHKVCTMLGGLYMELGQAFDKKSNYVDDNSPSLVRYKVQADVGISAVAGLLSAIGNENKAYEFPGLEKIKTDIDEDPTQVRSAIKYVFDAASAGQLDVVKQMMSYLVEKHPAPKVEIQTQE